MSLVIANTSTSPTLAYIFIRPTPTSDVDLHFSANPSAAFIAESHFTASSVCTSLDMHGTFSTHEMQQMKSTIPGSTPTRPTGTDGCTNQLLPTEHLTISADCVRYQTALRVHRPRSRGASRPGWSSATYEKPVITTIFEDNTGLAVHHMRKRTDISNRHRQWFSIISLSLATSYLQASTLCVT